MIASRGIAGGEPGLKLQRTPSKTHIQFKEESTNQKGTRMGGILEQDHEANKRLQKIRFSLKSP